MTWHETQSLCAGFIVYNYQPTAIERRLIIYSGRVWAFVCVWSIMVSSISQKWFMDHCEI